MSYEIDNKRYHIRIKGTSDEIKIWVRELCYAVDGCASFYQIKEEVDNLEKRLESFAFTINRYQRIYFNKDSIIYTPNESGEAKKFFFKALVKPFFEQARKKIEGK